MKSKRIHSIDLLRGIVMILMLLDHCRHFMHASHCDPEDLNCTSPLLFFTRWITHYCAPVFIFLTGISAYLYMEKKGKAQAARFLLSRGAFLIFMEIVVFRFAWLSDYSNPMIMLMVIWAIGMSMVFLGLVSRYLNYQLLLGLGLLLVLGHNLLDGIPFDPATLPGKLGLMLHQMGKFSLGDSLSVWILYPLLPYFGLICLGFCAGKVYSEKFDPGLRRKYLLISGLTCITLFILLRLLNRYGDPHPWLAQKDFVYTVLAFLKTTKYPTSLIYLLMTIGPALVLLACFDKWELRIYAPIIEIGRVPMFFYLVHLFLIKFTVLAIGKMHACSLREVYAGWLIY